jgi:hypothetical protein
MMIAGSGILQNTGIGVSPALSNSLSGFNNLPITSQFSNIVSAASGTLSGGVLDSLRTMGQDFVAFTNAIPTAFSSALDAIAPGGVADGGFTGLVSDLASGIMGDGDLGYFTQVWNQATGFAGQVNTFVDSAINVAGAVGTTFGAISGGMDSLITGGLSVVSEASGAFGQDLGRLGQLVNLDNLPNLGNPVSLVQQLASVGGISPAVEEALRQSGASAAQISSLATGGYGGLSDSANRLLYENMTQITGSDLAQVKNILGVTTPGINNMAELLDPKKILPNSFPTLTMPTPDGLRGIYATTAGAVNTNLERFFIDPNAPAYTGDDPIVRARLGLPPQPGFEDRVLA